MAALTITLGLRLYRTSDRSITPTRKTVQQCILADKTLPRGHVYVGQVGHHSHRLPVPKWASPFVPGHSCSGSDWLPLYVEHIIQHLQADLHELCGCVLVCDCPPKATCEADVLAGLVFEECRAAPPQRELTRRGRRRTNLSGSRQVTMALAGLPATVADVISCRTQEALVQSFVSLYLGNFFVSFQFPMIEDVINSPPFTCFGRWLRNQELSWDGSLGPVHSIISV